MALGQCAKGESGGGNRGIKAGDGDRILGEEDTTIILAE